jgi:hypothetical protein
VSLFSTDVQFMYCGLARGALLNQDFFVVKMQCNFVFLVDSILRAMPKDCEVYLEKPVEH